MQARHSLLCKAILALALSALTPGARAAPAHGIAMYGTPALPPDFVSLPYANPDAPKGGRIVMGEVGGFDSLNPFVLKGRAPWGLSVHTVETLLGRSIDEPFTLYGLLAESVETDDDRSWVQFVIREGARFSDGSPVTAEDVLWSFETLGHEGHPRYRTAWDKIASAEAVDARTVRFTFTEPDRELPLILGLRPVLKKAQWEGKDFTATTLEPPVGSGPYVVADFEPGRQITFRRNPDWWGKDLPFNRGLHNLDELRYDYFADAGVMFEAFKAGELDVFRETNAARWQTGYSFPAITSGEVIRAEIPHSRPSGMFGLAFNTRREVFADWRVRQALIEAFNFEFINQTVNGGTEPRITSYYANSTLAMDHGPATGRVAELIQPFVNELPPDAMASYNLPVAAGGEANRANIRRAMDLLKEAGWTSADGTLRDASGRPFAFEILLPQGGGDMQAAAGMYVQALRRLGIEARMTMVDNAQFVQRTNTYDFDMAPITRALSLSPGNEQWLYWGSEGVTQPGTRNIMGIDLRAVDALIPAILSAASEDEFRARVQALDRVLTTGRYAIPMWYSNRSRLAHGKKLKYPQKLPVYGDWPGFLPEAWWHEE